MVSLVLGVIDVPYDNKGGEATTTAMVANFLEAKYHVMETYVTVHQADIFRALNNSIEGALEDLFSGAPMRDPFQDATAEITSGFRLFLSTGEMERMGVAGVPTEASIKRRSLRFKKKQTNGYRPSFIDTSTYELSFRCWVKT